MLVEKMLEILKTADPKAEIVMSEDAEGNSFSGLADVEFGSVLIKDPKGWDGEVYPACEVDEGDETVNAIVFWPV